MKTTTTKTPRNGNQTTLSAFVVALLAAFTFSSTAQAETVIWNGDDTGGDQTWTDPDSNSWSGGQYDNGDDAEFNGAGLGTVTLSGTINPNSVLVNSAGDYTFSGAAITGAGNLTKDGSGTLTLSGANTYTGTTFINGGTLVAGVNDVPATSGALGNGGNIDFGGGTLQYGTGVTQDYSSRVVNSTSAITVDTNGETVIWNTELATSNTGGLTKEGAGTLRIRVQTNGVGHSGATTINEGTLQIFNNTGSRHWNPGLIYINNGSTLQFNGGLQTIMQGAADNITIDSNGGGSILLSTNLIWRSAGIITTGGSQSTVSGAAFNGQNNLGHRVIYTVADGTDDQDLLVSTSHNGQVGITKNGAGTLALTSSSNAMGANTIIINDGTLEVGGSGRLSNGNYSSNITINGDANTIFKHSSDQVQTLSGNISGAGSLEKIGGAKLTLSGNNSYSGTTTIGDGVSAGVIQAGSNTGLSSNSAFTLNSGTTLILDGFDNTIGSLAGAGAVRNDSLTTAATLTTGGDNSSTTFSGILTNGSGALALSLTKEGTGTMTITGTQQHTGTTTVSGGTLSMASGSGHSGSGDYVVQGGTLEIATGVNLSNHAMTISLGGVISPGNSPGTAITGSQTWDNGGSYLWEINNSNGTKGVDEGWDWLDITGTLDLTGLSAGGFTIDITSLTTANDPGFAAGFDYSGLAYGDPFGTTFIIASADTISGFDASLFTLDDSAFVNGKLDWSIIESGTDLVLTAVFVPEPSSTALLGLGLSSLLLRRRRS